MINSDITFSFKSNNYGCGDIEWIEMSGGSIPDGWTKTLSMEEIFRYLVYYQKKRRRL